LNLQYAYGWAVPFLCLWLLRRNRNNHSGELPTAPLKSGKAERPDNAFRNAARRLERPALLLLALLYAPIRLIQEANPEWRLVSWALALQVVGLTLVVVHRVARGTEHVRNAGFAFPVLFFLVSVPWPTPLEAPLTRALSRANAATTVEVLSLAGLPVFQHGNVLEVGSGMVGIDDACSGIRSLQASVMLSLFFGEIYRLTALGRGLCLFGGVGIAFVFNVARTTLLTWVAARDGVAALARWHDPAGVGILVGCFGLVWFVALWLGRSRDQDVEGGAHVRQFEIRRSGRLGSLRFEGAVGLAWFIAVEVGTEAWYRSHEMHLPPAATWTIGLPRENPSFREVRLPDKTRQLLRYDEGCSGTWQEAAGLQLQAFFFRWKPGRAAAHLAKAHTPASCLSAAGHDVISESEVRLFPVKGLRLPFRSYVFDQGRVRVHVYYCLWEDRGAGRAFGRESLTYPNRLGRVLSGQRNLGQRSLEVAIGGIEVDNDADLELQRQLEQIVIPASVSDEKSG
jgi:exosortase